ncbi:two-component system sensor histidine kinase NtrB [Desulforhopalus sp. 52FAK]
MKFSSDDLLTIAVCQNFVKEASLVFNQEGWKDVELVSFPARCGGPSIAEEEITILPNRSEDMIVVGGKCLIGLQNNENISTIVKENCFCSLCGSSFVQQLLGDGAYITTPGRLRTWGEGKGEAELGLTGEVDPVTYKKIVLLDTLVDDNTRSHFEDFLKTTGFAGENLEVGCDYYGLYLHRIVTDWRMQKGYRRLQQARAKSSEATLILNLLALLEPAISFEKAGEQLTELFAMFMAPEHVGVEIVSNAVTDFRFTEDPSSISLSAFSSAGLYKSDRIEGFYLLVPIDKGKNAVIRVAGIYLAARMNDYMALSLSLKGLIRLILYNGILYNDLHAEIIHKAQIEKYLEKSENHFRLLYENAPLPYHALNEQGEILEVNNAWLQALGLEKSAVVGEQFEKFLSPESLGDYQEFHNRLFVEEDGPWSIELKMIKNDSTPIQVQLDETTSTDSDGNIHQIHCIFVDISERKRIKSLILQSEKLSTIAGLAAGIAHEINTPLSGIMQSAQLIEMFLDPENKQSVSVAEGCGVDLVKVREYTQKQDLDYFVTGIRNSAVSASEIIKNLLEFSRPTKGEWAAIRLPHMLDQIVKLILSDYNLKKKYNVINVVFETDYDSNLPFIYCVPVEVEQVFFNIIKNAVHAMGKSGTKDPRVKIRTRLEKNRARIEIEDNGPGIGVDTMKHAFDPFFTTKEPGEGTGLGLSVSYAIVVGKHSGLIWIDPDFTSGTRFIIELPVETSHKKIL